MSIAYESTSYAELGAAGPGAAIRAVVAGSAVVRHRRSGSGWTTATGILADQRRSVAYQRLPAGPSRHCGPMQSLISRVTVRPSAYASCEPGRRTVPSVSSRCSSTVRKMPDWARAACSSRTSGRQMGIVGPVSCTRWSVSQRSVAGRRTGSHHCGAAPSRAIRCAVAASSSSCPNGAGTLRLRGRRARWSLRGWGSIGGAGARSEVCEVLVFGLSAGDASAGRVGGCAGEVQRDPAVGGLGEFGMVGVRLCSWVRVGEGWVRGSSRP
jgi:hypothetical protein